MAMPLILNIVTIIKNIHFKILYVCHQNTTNDVITYINVYLTSITVPCTK